MATSLVFLTSGRECATVKVTYMTALGGATTGAVVGGGGGGEGDQGRRHCGHRRALLVSVTVPRTGQGSGGKLKALSSMLKGSFDSSGSGGGGGNGKSLLACKKFGHADVLLERGGSG